MSKIQDASMSLSLVLLREFSISVQLNKDNSVVVNTKIYKQPVVIRRSIYYYMESMDVVEVFVEGVVVGVKLIGGKRADRDAGEMDENLLLTSAISWPIIFLSSLKEDSSISNTFFARVDDLECFICFYIMR